MKIPKLDFITKLKVIRHFFVLGEHTAGSAMAFLVVGMMWLGAYSIYETNYGELSKAKPPEYTTTTTADGFVCKQLKDVSERTSYEIKCEKPE